MTMTRRALVDLFSYARRDLFMQDKPQSLGFCGEGCRNTVGHGENRLTTLGASGRDELFAEQNKEEY